MTTFRKSMQAEMQGVGLGSVQVGNRKVIGEQTGLNKSLNGETAHWGGASGGL